MVTPVPSASHITGKGANPMRLGKSCDSEVTKLRFLGR